MYKQKDENRRRILDDTKQFSSLLSETLNVSGKLAGNDNCIINGKVEGDCHLDGSLMLGATGYWEGNITAYNVVISGMVRGNITAGNKLELSSTAKVIGSIRSPAIAIAEGAVHDGEIQMLKQTDVMHYKEKRKDKDSE
ncbi:MAG TPA: polymer-forming cytoskeletal protein [Gammaproteobacteria bacterium]